MATQSELCFVTGPLHHEPVVLLNTAGFYDGMICQLQRMQRDGLLPLPLADMVFPANDGAAALAYLEECGVVP
jgi:hypothetical protein